MFAMIHTQYHYSKEADCVLESDMVLPETKHMCKLSEMANSFDSVQFRKHTTCMITITQEFNHKIYACIIIACSYVWAYLFVLGKSVLFASV